MAGTKLYGIIAAQNPDNVGETIIIDGIDISKLHLIKDEHTHDNFFHSIGSITYAKKIYSEKDCENPKQIRAWRHAKVPFLYGEGELSDDTDHPNAQSAAALLKFTQRDDIPLDIGWSIDGGIAERQTLSGEPTEDKEMGKILSKTVALAGSLTVKPCNPKCLAWLENDLTKSAYSMPAPANYKELLQKSRASSSVIEDPDLVNSELWIKLEYLKKSLNDYLSGFTDMRCNSCGKPVRFFKASDAVPHKCGDCSGVYSMKQIWKALNK